jgi:glutaredoxin 3
MPAGPARVVIYTTRLCGFCFAAKRLLDKKGVAYQEVACDGRSDLRGWLQKMSGQHTVPQIFINGASIGGYSELSGLEEDGELDALLTRSPDANDPTLRQ